MPVLIGWSAVTDSLAWAAVVLFLVIFFWTPPHYWPLSMRYRDDYAAAGVPMLPVVAGAVAVARQIVVYSLGDGRHVAGAGAGRGHGLGLPVVAVVAGGAVPARGPPAARAAAKAPEPHDGRRCKPMRLFHFSITYLTLLFLAVAVDPLLHLPL